MTIAFSGASPSLIVMTVDSAVVNDFADHREYEKGRKAYCFQGVGCVTTWGERVGNCIGLFLDGKNISSKTHSVEELADLVDQYLRNEYRPHDGDPSDVGYHVAGFNQNQEPRLYHIFWGFDRPRPANQTCRKYQKYNHSPCPDKINYLYNGRNDLADIVVNKLIDEIQSGADMRFDPRTDEGLVRLGDLIVRFAAEITKEVGKPFFTFLISRLNKIVYIENDGVVCPINQQEISQKLRELHEDLS